MHDLFQRTFDSHFCRQIGVLKAIQAAHDAAAPEELPEEPEDILIAIDDARHCLLLAEQAVRSALEAREADGYHDAMREARSRLSEATDWMQAVQ